jgi:predicted secreted hydrolase
MRDFGSWFWLAFALFMLAACAQVPVAPDSLQPTAELLIAKSQPLPEFDRVIEPREFRFPEDHGPHTRFQSEWWYYTGNLRAETGERLSYQFTIFRRGITPEQPNRSSDLAADQIFFAHFAISHIDRADHQFSERFSRGAADLAGATGLPYSVYLEDWRIEALDDQGRTIHLVAQETGMAIDLRLEAVKPIVIHGEGGVSAKSSERGNASYYLSYTRMETSGSVRFGEESYTVEGESWFDHEWSTSALGEGVVGWDWFSLQLDDDQEIMLYLLRRENGSVESVSAGTLVRSDGSLRSLALADFEIAVLDTWESPESGAIYPSGWRVEIPGEAIQLDVEPTFLEQENIGSFTYWEGSVDIDGSVAGKPVGGQGFVELTGYLTSLAGVF